MKNRYYDRKESLGIDMAAVRYRQVKVLNRHNGKVVKINAWKPVQKNESPPLMFSVILYQVMVLRCTLISLKTASTIVAGISHCK